MGRRRPAVRLGRPPAGSRLSTCRRRRQPPMEPLPDGGAGGWLRGRIKVDDTAPAARAARLQLPGRRRPRPAARPRSAGVRIKPAVGAAGHADEDRSRVPPAPGRARPAAGLSEVHASTRRMGFPRRRTLTGFVGRKVPAFGGADQAGNRRRPFGGVLLQQFHYCGEHPATVLADG